MEQLKFNIIVLVLKSWTKVHDFYGAVRSNATLRKSLIFGFLVIFVALFLLGGSPKSAKIDPYAALELPRSATAKEIRSAFRTLSKIYMPDVGSNPSKERFIEMNKAQEILLDEKQRKNYDVHGDPAGAPFSFYEIETYPDTLLKGKAFVFLYTIAALLVLCAPLSLLLNPMLEEPPTAIIDGITAYIVSAEVKYQQQEQAAAAALADLKNASHSLLSVCQSFPAYNKSIWKFILGFRIAARKAQLGIRNGEVEESISELREYRDQFKRSNLAKNKVIAANIGFILDELDSSLSKANSKVPKAKIAELSAIVGKIRKQ